jgi:glycosyltransferase involved in cell wall biosynthesis
MQPKVTVLTSVYNGLPYLKEAIDSTLNQTYKDFEYLIIDDCSTDDSVSVIESYDDSRIRLVKNGKNLGTAETINKGLSIINSKYIVRLDQDDVSLANRVEEQISYLEKNPNLDIVCSWEHTIDHNGKRIRDWQTEIRSYGEFLGPVLLGLCPIWHPSIAFKRNAMIEAGGFDPSYTRAEDFEVTTRMAIKRYSAGVVPKYLLLQREHNKRQSVQYEKIQKKLNNKIQRNALKYFINHELIDDFSSFIKFENIPKNKRSKTYLLEYSNITLKLFESVKSKQNLTFEEIKHFKNVFIKKLGYGILYCQYFKFFPRIIFNLFFYILSPLSNPVIRSPIAKFYNKFQIVKSKSLNKK